jgi:hypothetical protein
MANHAMSKCTLSISAFVNKSFVSYVFCRAVVGLPFDDTTQEALFMVIMVEVLPFCPVLFLSWRLSDWRSGVFTGLEGLGGVYRFWVYIRRRS